MGTDIHLFVERRASANEPWQLVSVRTKCSWCDGSCKNKHADSACYGCKGTGLEAGYGSRKYSVFAMLADVRNGRGFAGCDIGSGFVPVAEPRGLPADMSAELKAIHNASDDSDWEKRYATLNAAYGESNLGDHSMSHLTVRELLDYDWTRMTEHHGVCNVNTYAAWQKAGTRFPEHWSGGVGGPQIYNVTAAFGAELAKCVTPAEGSRNIFEKRLAGDRIELTDFLRQCWSNCSYKPADLEDWANNPETRVGIYMPVSIPESYADAAGHFYSRFLPALVALGDPSNTRIVFGFDS